MRPENDTIRRKRDLEFQSRVLTALEKPEENRFWALLNKPFTLWALSLILLTLGGSYFTAYRQCRQDAYTQIADFIEIRQELFERVNHVHSIVENSSTISGMQTEMARPFFKDLKFKEYSLEDLIKALDVQSSMFAIGSRTDVWPFEEGDPESFLNAVKGDFSKLTDANIPKLREVFRVNDTGHWAILGTAMARREFVPVCSAGVLYRRAIYAEPIVIVGAVPGYGAEFGLVQGPH